MKNIYRKWWFWGIVGIIFSLVALKIDGLIQSNFTRHIIPYAWIGAYWFVLFLILAWRANKDSRWKLVLSYICIVPLCLSIGEVYGYILITSSIQSEKKCDVKSSGTYNTQYYMPSQILGYKGNANSKITSHRINTTNNETIYNVTYNTDSNGWRITPQANDTAKQCVIFFGDSFTIGEGLEDNQTLPYYFNQATNGVYRIYNFGFHGYGPHHALALLQSGEVKRIAKDCTQTIGIYENLPDHIKRANNFSAWEKQNISSPRFRLQNNELVWLNKPLTNTHDSQSANIKTRLLFQLDKSFLFQSLAPKYKYDDESNAVYFAILKAIESELKNQFDAPFYFLFWEAHNNSDELESKQSSAIMQWLQNAKIPYFLVSEILPNYTQNRQKYGIHSCDLHPNPNANQIIASFLAKKLHFDNTTESKQDSANIKFKQP